MSSEIWSTENVKWNLIKWSFPIDGRPYRTYKALAVYQFILFCLSVFFPLVYLFFLSMVVSNLSRYRWDRGFDNLRLWRFSWCVNLHLDETFSTWWDSHPKPRDYCFSIPVKDFDAGQDFRLFFTPLSLSQYFDTSTLFSWPRSLH
jgi:hypothetical protein